MIYKIKTAESCFHHRFDDSAFIHTSLSDLQFKKQNKKQSGIIDGSNAAKRRFISHYKSMSTRTLCV